MRLITHAELRTLKGIPFSRVHIYRLVKAGKFPRPISMGGASNARNLYVEDEIDEYIRGRMAERDTIRPK